MNKPLLRVATALLAIAATAAAQTTWTSFEDRKGHAIAADVNGGVLMFGGESVDSPGKLLGDTKSLSSNNQTWADVGSTLLPKARTEHALSAGSSAGLPIFVMFGGLADNGGGTQIPSDDTFTFSYGGGGWGKVNPPVGSAVPPARTGHAMVHDRVRNRVVLFGGRSNGIPVSDTWEFGPTTNTWNQVIISGGAPIGRFYHCLAYNSLTGLTYLFGGSGNRDDTWIYDPAMSTWTNVTQTARPQGRRQAAMSYLDVEDHIVLFGGRNSITNFSDTWTLHPYTFAWTQAAPSITPSARHAHAMSADQQGNHVVLLGGTQQLTAGAIGSILTSTWLWDGTNWIEELPAPSPRAGVAMAYDSARKRHVMFGGSQTSSGAILADTWELEGLNWRPASVTGPSPRTNASMAYDNARSSTVLFGGRQSECGQELSDTWEWNGANWTQRTFARQPTGSAGAPLAYDDGHAVSWLLSGDTMWQYDGTTWQPRQPQPRSAFAHAFDSSLQRLVVFGGAGLGATELADTWEWTTSGWHNIQTAVQPGPRWATGMSYHLPTNTCVLFGGYTASTDANINETWLLSANSWLTASAAGLPRAAHAQAFDPFTNSVVAFGGSVINGMASNRTDVWSGTMWTNVAGALPPPRAYPAMTADTLHGELVMFGGVNSGVGLNDTWVFNGTSWSAKSPSVIPPAGAWGMTFDSHTQSPLMFGGIDAQVSQQFTSTWSWTGSNWMQRPTTSAPPGRFRHAMFSTGARTLIFGGRTLAGPLLNDMWEWDGTTWSALDDGSPPPRVNFSMCHDSRRQRTVLFGGESNCGAGTFLNDTWEWDGRAWHRTAPVTSPAQRASASITYDASRSRVVLFGGRDASGSINDTWEWDGSSWSPRSVTNSPPPSSGHGLTFDADRRQTIAFGAMGTWDYGPINPGTVESIPTSTVCQSSLGTTPQITPTTWCGPWLGDSIGLDLTAVPPSLAMMILGFTSLPNIPLPPPLGTGLCTLDVSVDILEVLFPLPDPYISGPLPNNTNLLGAELYMQAALFDLGLPGNPIITSNSLHLTLGAK